jgi:ER lumen protein retaining receptor
MDIFQLIGDFLHLMAVLMLVLKILANRNVLGLSYKTQELFLVVFLLRYIDIFTWRTLYLFAMKVLFISLTAYTIYLIRFKRPFNLVNLKVFRVMIKNMIVFLTILYI